jgi:hypothetical protein
MLDYEHIPFKCRKCHAHAHLFKDFPLNKLLEQPKSQRQGRGRTLKKSLAKRKAQKKIPPSQTPKALAQAITLSRWKTSLSKTNPIPTPLPRSNQTHRPVKTRTLSSLSPPFPQFHPHLPQDQDATMTPIDSSRLDLEDLEDMDLKDLDLQSIEVACERKEEHLIPRTTNQASAKCSHKIKKQRERDNITKR